MVVVVTAVVKAATVTQDPFTFHVAAVPDRYATLCAVKRNKISGFFAKRPALLLVGRGARQVATRLFPFSRGLFEDKVANLWFCADVVFKLRRRFAMPQLAKLALVSTLRWVVGVGVVGVA